MIDWDKILIEAVKIDGSQFTAPGFVMPSVKFTVKNGEWKCSRCGEELGAVQSKDGWETFIPNTCKTQRTCSDEVSELAEFAMTVDQGRYEGSQQ